MTKAINKYKINLIAALILFSPILLFAAPTIQNPLKSNDVNKILLNLMDLVAMVGGVVVVFFIIYSGFKFVTAGSSDSDRTKAKQMFYSTVVGAAILLGADVIANVVVNTVKTTTGIR